MLFDPHANQHLFYMLDSASAAWKAIIRNMHETQNLGDGY
jgi:hypothetical protein